MSKSVEIERDVYVLWVLNQVGGWRVCIRQVIFSVLFERKPKLPEPVLVVSSLPATLDVIPAELLRYHSTITDQNKDSNGHAIEKKMK